MSDNQLLGLDVGKVRTGVARASWAAGLAEPLKTVHTATAAEELRELIKRYKVDTIVVGLPRNLNGEDTQQTAWVRQWVGNIKKQLEPTFYWQDEAATSRLAERRVSTSKKNRYLADAIAASIVLQDFIDSPETERSSC